MVPMIGNRLPGIRATPNPLNLKVMVSQLVNRHMSHVFCSGEPGIVLLSTRRYLVAGSY